MHTCVNVRLHMDVSMYPINSWKGVGTTAHRVWAEDRGLEGRAKRTTSVCMLSVSVLFKTLTEKIESYIMCIIFNLSTEKRKAVLYKLCASTNVLNMKIQLHSDMHWPHGEFKCFQNLQEKFLCLCCFVCFVLFQLGEF